VDDFEVATVRSDMPSIEYYDLLQLLYECRDIVNEAQSRGLPTLVDRAEVAKRIKKLLAKGIIDASEGSLLLSAGVRSVLDEVAPGREFADFSKAEIERVVLSLLRERSQ
jgi:hypothetical protein